jgi:hypothetical protein
MRIVATESQATRWMMKQQRQVALQVRDVGCAACASRDGDEDGAQQQRRKTWMGEWL